MQTRAKLDGSFIVNDDHPLPQKRAHGFTGWSKNSKSFFINSENISPFVINGGAQNGLLNVISEDYWSEDDRNSYAFWPRLSQTFIENNNQTSTWWMRSGDFLRLKTMELGFSPKGKLLDKLHINGIRLYASGLNLAVWSDFDLWDPEMGGSGLGYPIQSVYNIGIQLDF